MNNRGNKNDYNCDGKNVSSERSQTICHQPYDSQRPWYSSCTRRHSRQKHQAPLKIRIPLKPITPTPLMRQCHMKTEKTVASWPVTRRTSSPRWRGPHHGSMSTVPTVCDVIHDRSIKHRTKLESHSNPLLQPLPWDNVTRRLKRQWPADL